MDPKQVGEKRRWDLASELQQSCAPRVEAVDAEPFQPPAQHLLGDGLAGVPAGKQPAGVGHRDGGATAALGDQRAQVACKRFRQSDGGLGKPEVFEEQDNRPMRAREIWTLIQERSLYMRSRGRTPWATISSKLSTDPQFERVAPGLYRLRR